MFEALGEADARDVRRWEAPRIGRGLPPPGVRVANVDGASSGTDPMAKSGPFPATDLARDSVASSPAPPPRAPMTMPPDALPERRVEEGKAERERAELEDRLRRELSTEAATLLRALARERDARDAVLEDELLALARAMARLIVRRELEHDAGLMRGVVREALARLPRLSEAPVVRLHPVDAAAVEVPSDGAGSAVVVIDETLARGDCRIESGATLIDAGIDAWVACIAARHDAAEEEGGDGGRDTGDVGDGAASDEASGSSETGARE